ncbi:c-type cytochrome [Dasania sp. GY-MA-18]|uniref:cytochrome-c oxidase n=1 Tax=Dasania phycosphaerae TaxID=2950436 RepID=A0A9J6RIU5_9GAMM|nr:MULTISPECIES: c-type cytochrome [Dasania]MCR8921473.1 c-type cytochrome [Dasania sp. GY-MA-18]MCZ0863901.1 c-type cytochrome [Dasania phycosphaerae]MCZ0867629.1 c-type cytochrome [Dasania phycosphaerae]
MLLAIVLVLLVVGSLVFHFMSPWWFTPLASNWGSIDSTINITFWVTGAVFIAVNIFLAYCVYRYRHQHHRRSHYEPENKKLETWLMAITTVGVAAMLAPGLIVWAKFVEVPAEAHVIEAVGQQWQWSFRLPGKDGKLGTVDTRHISASNPFGINPNDSAGLDDVLVFDSELHLPIDKPVKIELRSKDVLHNFAVSEFRVKMDLVPGLVSYLWLTPTKLGRYDILCMELCGLAHYAMRGNVVVESEADYQRWVNSQATFASSQQRVVGDAQLGKALYATCGGCHGQQGEGNRAMNAPALSGQSASYMARQLVNFKQGIRGQHPKDSYGQQMAAMANLLADQSAIDHVVAYIQSLPKPQLTATISNGDRQSGHGYFVNCGACHGSQGEGNSALNAPALVGLDDWYIKRQLLNFKQGIRGTHNKDTHGRQMMLMARLLNDEQAIDDLLTYINSL